MPRWLLKSFVQRVISMLPNSQKWNEFLQQHVTKSLRLDRMHCVDMIVKAKRHLDVRARNADLADFTVLEIGTGWYPVAPIVFILCGASKVWTFDIEHLISADRLESLLAHFRELVASNKLAELLPNLCRSRIDFLLPPTGGDAIRRLREMGIEYRLQDASSTGLPNSSVDHFFSHSVMQYIPRGPLMSLMNECMRVAKPHATHSHHILLKDQFSIFDKSITEFDFLRFSDRLWRWLDSPLIPQTRLRISDYRNIFAEAGWRLLAENSEDGNLEALRRVKLDERFRGYSEADLLVVSTWMELGN